MKICVSSYASWKRGYTSCSGFPLWNHRKLIDHYIKFVTYLWNMFKIFEPCKFWYVFFFFKLFKPNPSLYCNLFFVNILATCSSFPQCYWVSCEVIFTGLCIIFCSLYVICFICFVDLGWMSWDLTKLIFWHLSLVDHVYNKICHNMFSVTALLGHVCTSYYFG